MQLVDSHCHLMMEQFEPDRSQVVARANKAQVTRIVIPGIDLDSSRQAVALAEEQAGLYAAVGLHPSAADQWQDDTAQALRELAESESVIAIGEIGLDYHHRYHPVELQKRALEAQLELAAELELPVIVHNRQSVADLLDILASWHGSLPQSLKDRAGVLHAFEGTIDQGQTAAELGFFLGVGGPITFKNADDKRTLFNKVPLDRTLVETDAPFVTPHPHRGERNEPAFTRLVAEALAGLHGEELGLVADITTDNANTLFGWSNGTSNSNIL